MNQELLNLFLKRRSIRKFKDRKIEKGKVKQLIQAALLPPSSHGRYPCRHIVVDDKKLILQLSKSKIHGSAFMSNAPLAIIVIADKKRSDAWVEDASIASTYIMLIAEWMGLGCCWIKTRERKHSESKSSEEFIREKFDIPDHFGVLAILALGYPDETKSSADIDELMYDRVFLNHFDKRYPME
jgi:nitroreductase